VGAGAAKAAEVTNIWVITATAAAGLLTAVGGGSIVTSLARRRPTRVEAVTNLNESTFEWAERIEALRQAEREAFDEDRAQFRADVDEARREAREVRVELGHAQDDVRAMRMELMQFAEIMAAIRDPGMTMPRLRALIERQDRWGVTTT